MANDKYLASNTITFKKKDGSQETFTCRDGQELLHIICPVDGTNLIETIGEDVYVSCPNCQRDYGVTPTMHLYSQEEINQTYQRKIENTEEQLAKLRRRFRETESRLVKQLKELKIPFKQELSQSQPKCKGSSEKGSVPCRHEGQDMPGGRPGGAATFHFRKQR